MNLPFYSNDSVAQSGISQTANTGLYTGVPAQQMSNSTFGTNPILSGEI